MLVGLEMDEIGMKFGAFLGLGLVLGGIYFYGVWRSARGFTTGAPMERMVLLSVGRLVLMGGVLALISRAGAMPLLATALGIVLARPLVMRRLRA
jgi:hypothetical protein